jgi:hypothetical protein
MSNRVLLLFFALRWALLPAVVHGRGARPGILPGLEGLDRTQAESARPQGHGYRGGSSPKRPDGLLLRGADVRPPDSQTVEFDITNLSNDVIQYEIDGRVLPLPPRSKRTHQTCWSPELAFQWPDTQKRAAVQPNNGEHYAIVQEDTGQFRLRASDPVEKPGRWGKAVP